MRRFSHRLLFLREVMMVAKMQDSCSKISFQLFVRFNRKVEVIR